MARSHGDREVRRRRRLRQAVLPPQPASVPGPGEQAGERPLRAVSGRIVDASPHLLVLYHDGGAANAAADTSAGTSAGTAAGTLAGCEIRLPMSESTTVWYGGRADLAALRPGRQVIVRPTPNPLRADRIWVDITRVTGTIVSYDSEVVEVDPGPHRRRTRVLIPQHSLAQVLVRHPHLEPGYLIDVIAVHSADGPLAVRPGTSQPGYRADDPPMPPPGEDVTASQRLGPQPRLRGTVTWFGGTGAVGAARGAAYPALDPEGTAGGCAAAPMGCAPLPYLSLGSELAVHNDCTGQAGPVSVIECGCAAARYCDRCVRCGTSPRGRIAELTALSFVDLGGDLDAGCFNATLAIG